MGRSDSIRQEDIDRSKELQLFILRHLMKFCKKHNIAMFAAWGTLLGAVRHKGYIPWDDDIDVAMTRTDYDRFVRTYLADEEQAVYELYCFESDKRCPFPFAKLRLTGTSLIQSDTTSQSSDPGIAIDIFPLDKMPQDRSERRAHYKKLAWWTQLYISSAMWKAGNLRAGWQARILTVIRVVLHVLLWPIPREKLYQKYRKAAAAYAQSEEKLFGFSANANFDQCINEDDLFPIQMLPFEQEEIPAPASPHRWLTDTYGDYMKFPPAHQRFGHRPLRIDFGRWETEQPPL